MPGMADGNDWMVIQISSLDLILSAKIQEFIVNIKYAKILFDLFEEY